MSTPTQVGEQKSLPAFALDVAGRRRWVGVALAMVVVGWGSSQFAAMLPEYRQQEGLSGLLLGGLWGIYAVGLVPSLILASRLADRWGLRRTVLCGLLCSGLASVLLVIGDVEAPVLAAARLLAAVAAGLTFAPASAWILEVTEADGPGDPLRAARRAAISISTGFAVGPLLAGLLGEFALAPLVVSPLLQLTMVLAAVAFVFALPAPVAAQASGATPGGPLPAGWGRWLLATVVPIAPWVFVTANMASPVLPGIPEVSVPGHEALLIGTMCALSTAAGVAVQPLAKRLNGRSLRLGEIAGMAAAVVGLALAVATLALGSFAVMVVASLLLGTAYGFCFVATLARIESYAAPWARTRLLAIGYALMYSGFVTPELMEIGADVASRTVTALLLLGGASACLLLRLRAGEVGLREG